MPQFDRLGNDMSDDIADAEAERAECEDKAHTKALVEAVKKYAIDHYEEGGWDMVVECYETKEIEEEVAGCATEAEAIARLAEVAGIYHDRRLDAWHAGGLDDHGREPEPKEEEKVRHHCTCRDYDDCCDWCSYQAWMEDMKESGEPMCDDGGFRPYKSGQSCRETYNDCYLSQGQYENEIPF